MRVRKNFGWAAGAALVGVVAAGIWLPAIGAAAGSLDEKFDLTGDVRVRLRHIDSPDTGDLAGTYGEALIRGFSLKHRFVLEAAYALTDAVTAGGMLRASNEGEAVLEAGPEYLSSKFGSAFIAYETPTLRSRLGYYSLAYSPLTLMRWDSTDDPEGGGGGCGCGGGAAAGAILGETLEELGPDLTFEGGRVSLSPGGDLGLDGFLARPREAGADYQLVTYGGRASFVRYVVKTQSFLDIGLIAVRSEEDKHSLPSGSAAGVPTSNAVYGVTWKIPVPAPTPISLEGEYTSTRSSGVTDREGFGAIVSLALKPHRALQADASYIYLTENWDSYFRALSYNPDRKGVRVRIQYRQDPIEVALFARLLRTMGTGTVYPTLSARGFLKMSPALRVGLAAIYAAEGHDDDSFVPPPDIGKTTALGTLTYEFVKGSTLTLEGRYIWNRVEHSTGSERDYDVSMISLYVRAGLW
jgi:hypothetical protein